MSKRRRKEKAMPNVPELEPLYPSPDEDSALRLLSYPNLGGDFPYAELVTDGSMLLPMLSVYGCPEYALRVRHRHFGYSDTALEGWLVEGGTPSREVPELSRLLMARLRGSAIDGASFRLAGALVRAWRKKVGDDAVVAQQGPTGCDGGAEPSGSAP